MARPATGGSASTLLIWAALAGNLAAQGPGPGPVLHWKPAPLPQFGHASDSFPSPLSVTSLAGDSFGETPFLWTGTTTGLYRFDGRTFRLIATEPVSHVAVTADGWVWTGNQQRLIAYRRGEKRPVRNGVVTGLAARGDELLAAIDGVLWRGGIGKLSQLEGARVNGPLALDTDRSAWFGCGTGICALDVQGDLVRKGSGDGVPVGRWLAAIRDDAGNHWAWNRKDMVSVRRGQAYRVAAAELSDLQAVRTNQGRIWLSGPRWIERDGTPHFGAMSDLPRPLARQLAEDRYGSVWFGTTGTSAIVLVSPHSWSRGWRLETNLPTAPRAVGRVARTESGRVLAATEIGIAELDERTQDWTSLPGAFRSDAVLNFAEAANGDLWVIFRNSGIARIDRRGRRIATAFDRTAVGIDFRCFLRDRFGRLWVGAKGGLYRIEEDTARLKEVSLPPGPGLPPETVSNPVTFATSSDGQEWMGSELGISRLEADGWKTVVPASELLSKRVRSIAVAPGPVFWVCYRAKMPISRIYREGAAWKRRDFTDEQAYWNRETLSLLVDRRGWIWRGTDAGLFASNGVDLEPYQWARFVNASMPSSRVEHYGLFEDPGGSLWVATYLGPARIDPDPAWFRRQEPPAPPRVTRIAWQGKEHLWPAGEALPAGRGTLEIDIGQWPRPVPLRPATRVRLAPLESAWRVTEDDPVVPVRYENLPSGEYRLEMQAVWGTEVHSYQFRIGEPAPILSQRAWGLLAGLLGVTGSGLWGWRVWLRRRQRAAYWEAKQAFLEHGREGEREVPASLGDVLAGRYTIEAVLGEGGFSRVYRARAADGAIVAVKVLYCRGEFPEWQRSRFEREVEALRQIEHPGVVGLLDSGWITETDPYLVMRYVDGPTLRQVLQSGPLDRAKAVRWIREIGEALAAAHGRDVLHRDLKPENILIEGMGEESEHVVLIDFGAAVIRDAVGGRGSTVMFVSFGYSPPERAQGRSSPATDVYSLAAVAIEMLTGVRYASLSDGSESGLRQAMVGFSNEVIRLLAAGVAFVPSDRPAEVGIFAESLTRALTGPADQATGRGQG